MVIWPDLRAKKQSQTKPIVWLWRETRNSEPEILDSPFRGNDRGANKYGLTTRKVEARRVK